MELRHRIVSVVRNAFQSRENGPLEKKDLETEISIWGERGFDIDTPSEAIEFSIFGNDLCSGDLGICTSCIAHLERMIDHVRSQGIDAKALPILISPVKDYLEQCHHKASLSDIFRSARLGTRR